MRTTVPTTFAAFGAALAVSSALVACTTTTAGTAAGRPVARVSTPSASTTHLPPARSTPAPRTATALHTTPAAPPSTHAANEVDAVLLSGAEIGAGFVAVSDEAAPSPLPCTPNRPPVDEQVRNVEKGSADFVDRAGALQVSEEIYVYGSVTDAVRHQHITEAGLACREGTLAGTTIDIVGPTDVAKKLTPQVSKAEGWSVANTSIGGSLVQVRINAVVVQFAFVARAGSEPALDAKQVVETALAKIINHG